MPMDMPIIFQNSVHHTWSGTLHRGTLQKQLNPGMTHGLTGILETATPRGVPLTRRGVANSFTGVGRSLFFVHSSTHSSS